MKAIILNKYGPPEELRYDEVAKPTPKEGQVLVEVRAAAINDWELGLIRGSPLFMRFFLGFFRPKVRIMGCDVAGRVEAVAEGVTRFAPGDDVYGDLSGVGFGAFAEYVSVPRDALELMPRNLSHEQAATVPHAAGLALQSLRRMGPLDGGKKLLINGAGGGVGTIAIQYAKLHGVEVTGVDSRPKLEFMKVLGCDHVVDYTKIDFTRMDRRYDLILDTKTRRSPIAYARALGPGGRYVTVGGSMPRVFLLWALAPWFAKINKKQMSVLGLKPSQGVREITELIEAGKIVPSIGERFPLREVPKALRAFEESRHTGRIVITVP